ncbi:hypothetical protein CPC08DRAFT_717767 [Agrocybe pediades]|nr:hypothetical protein CPC08DRAFT_717767 [Agrocybe pediades]
MRGLRKHERMQRKLLGLLEHDKVHNPADFPREMGVHPADVFKQAFLNLRKVRSRMMDAHPSVHRSNLPTRPSDR